MFDPSEDGIQLVTIICYNTRLVGPLDHYELILQSR